MRDYKNVTVPKKYRVNTTRMERTATKRSTRRVARTQVPRAGSGLLKAVMLIMLAGTGFLGWHTYQWTERTGFFQISGIDVRGVSRVGEEDIKKIAGVFTGQHIFRADIQGAARRARSHPWVKNVKIERRLPNRISMTIEERVPAVLVEGATGRFLADSDGVIIEAVRKDVSGAWPLPVLAMRGESLRIGEEVRSEEFIEAFALMEELKRRGGWRLEDVLIRADSSSALTIVYAGHEIRIGAGRYDEKLHRLGEVLADIKQRGIRFAYVDLRPERQAAVMAEKQRVQGQGSRGRGKRP